MHVFVAAEGDALTRAGMSVIVLMSVASDEIFTAVCPYSGSVFTDQFLDIRLKIQKILETVFFYKYNAVQCDNKCNTSNNSLLHLEQL